MKDLGQNEQVGISGKSKVLEGLAVAFCFLLLLGFFLKVMFF